PPARTDRWETSRLRTERAPGPVRATVGPRVPAPGQIHREGARAQWPLQPARRGGRTPPARETASSPLETVHSGEGAGAGQAVARGRAAVTVVPFGPLSMGVRPPWAVIREGTMARPRPAMRPEPSVRVVTDGAKACAGR